MSANAHIASLPAKAAAAPRYERKMIADGFAPGEIRAMLQGHPDGFRNLFPARSINTLYFDTPSWTMYRVHVEGHSNRRKVRLRWYGPRDYNGSVRLEVKQRRGLTGWKEVYDLAECNPWDLANERKDLNQLALAGGAPGALLDQLQSMQPTAFVRYEREYWRPDDPSIRLTLDFNIEYQRPRLRGRTVRCGEMRDRTTIIELKYPVEAEDSAERITRHLPFRVMRNSKYINAVRGLYQI